jgi:hypothetical protein
MILSFVSSILSNGWPYSLWMTSAIGVGLTLLGVASTLIWPIIFPRILSYPWPMSEDYQHRRKDRNHTVVLAGSYNPPHSGHMAMIRYLSERYVMKGKGRALCVYLLMLFTCLILQYLSFLMLVTLIVSRLI